jgi:hypothetical protein
MSFAITDSGAMGSAILDELSGLDMFQVNRREKGSMATPDLFMPCEEREVF